MTATDAEARTGDRITQAAREFSTRPRLSGLTYQGGLIVRNDTLSMALNGLLGSLSSIVDHGPVTGERLAEAVDRVLRRSAEHELRQALRYAEHAEFAAPVGGVS